MVDRHGLARFAHSATTRLAATYLGIIMLMSLGFSLGLYRTSSQELGRQLPPRTVYGRFAEDRFRPEVERYITARIEEGRHALLLRLIGLNLITLAGGSLLSYGLARRTLAPIEAAMEAQSQFVSDASHELRTPLTAIQASNEVALRKPRLDLAEAKQLILQNTEDVVKLQALTDGLLRLATNQQAQPLAPTALQHVTSEAMTTIVPLAQAKDIAVEDQVTDLNVLADAPSLVQVLTILLDNAVKYSPNHTTVRIEAVAHKKHATLTVRDQGPGIAAVDLPHIFQRFYRADRARSKHTHDGYGLGLAIAHKLIQHQNGSLTAASQPGHGASFTIKLPLANL